MQTGINAVKNPQNLPQNTLMPKIQKILKNTFPSFHFDLLANLHPESQHPSAVRMLQTYGLWDRD
jgi:hypothetical protein